MTPTTPPTSLDQIAEAYVKLVLAVGRHDEDYVDAYYGPESWHRAVKKKPRSLEEISDRAHELIGALNTIPGSDDELVALRRRYLMVQLGSLAARVEMLGGARLRFDEESKALYDAVAPTNEETHFKQLIAELEPLLPGEGSLIVRYAAFRNNFIGSGDPPVLKRLRGEA